MRNHNESLVPRNESREDCIELGDLVLFLVGSGRLLLGWHADTDLGGPEKTVMQHVAGLQFVHDLVFLAFFGHMRDNFVKMRIECLACSFDSFEAVHFENIGQLLLYPLHTGNDRLQILPHILITEAFAEAVFA